MAKKTTKPPTAPPQPTTPVEPVVQQPIEYWPIERFVEYARNPRKNDHVVDKMAASIREFGFKIPVLAKSDGTIVDGHLRLKGAHKVGLAILPVILCDEWTEAQVKAFRLMVNRSVTWADWDVDLLGLELGELSGMDIDLSLTGFDADEIAEYMASGSKEGLTDADAVPEIQEKVVTQLGDLWMLGDAPKAHRVLCGDSTDLATVERLMDGAKADMVFTDPPYNVDYEGYTEEKLKLQGDKMDATRFKEFLIATFTSFLAAVSETASMYVCHPSSWQREFQDALAAAGFAVRCQIIWAKNTFAWGFGRYKFQHEPIFYCHVAGKSDAWYGDKTQSTLWEEKKPAANRLHPTMKPVELIERALVNSSQAANAVLDLFGGSGSTLIACEKTGRFGYLMELDPKYVDVIIRRWQEFAGKDATLAGDGRTFGAVLAERHPVAQ